MSGITSVQAHEEKPSSVGPAVLFIVGLLSIISGGSGPAVGTPILLAGVIWFFLQKTTYHVLLHTASGEAKALSSQDEAWISRVVHALNDSIVHRG
jgi:hypothetical protein